LANADNQAFNYSLGNGNDALNLAISASNLAAAGTGTREDFVLNINAGIGDDVISTAIVNDSGANGQNATLAAGVDTTPWYVNSTLNANLNINAGSGNDTVNTLGSGNWKITLGDGNDTYYADNTAGKAQWVFNTADQTTPNGVETERAIDNLVSDTSNRYISVNDANFGGGLGRGADEYSGLYGLKLRVAFSDVSTTTPGTYFSGVIDVPTASDKFVVTDLNINQAIKKAINEDPVLSKLLKATDGPANTLVVTSLSDGRHVNASDLQVEFAIPTTADAGDVNAWRAAIGASDTWDANALQQGRLAAFNQLIDKASGYATSITAAASAFDTAGPNPGTGYSAWYTSNTTTNGGDYRAAFANDGSTAIAGNNSTAVSDNTIDAGAGTDVIVLSTGGQSNDTIKWTGFGNGVDTIVNFDTSTAAATLTAAKYSLTVTQTTAVDGVTESGDFVVTLPGLGAPFTLSYTVPTWTTDIQAATSITTDLQAALNAQFGVGVWTVDNTGGTSATITVTQVTPAYVPGIGDASLSETFNVDGDYGYTLITSIQASSNFLGDDWLDFTSYGAKWLGAATLDTDGTGFVLNDWSVANDRVGAHTNVLSAASQNLSGVVVVNTTPLLKGDGHLHTGDQYITLTRPAATSTTDLNSHSTTQYKIELWTVNGDVADAYLKTTTDARDTAVLIGYVDVGQAIDGAASTQGVLAHIDYIV
jgi:hypothetical protein